MEGLTVLLFLVPPLLILAGGAGLLVTHIQNGDSIYRCLPSCLILLGGLGILFVNIELWLVKYHGGF